MSKKQKNLICKLIEDAIALYIMFALVWGIGYLVSDIFAKMGVA